MQAARRVTRASMLPATTPFIGQGGRHAEINLLLSIPENRRYHR
jgi:hypothetical protein